MSGRDQGSDASVLEKLGERLARHRLNRNQTQADLARDAGVSKRTIVRIERGESTQLTNFIRVLRALGLLASLDPLVPEAPQSPIQMLKVHDHTRRRASPARGAQRTGQAWVWGDEDSP